MADRQQYPSCFGPYLRYAIDSDFENFSTDLENFGRQFRIFDESQLRLFLFVEVKPDQSVQAFEQAMNAHNQFGTQFGPDVGKTQYATLRCLKAAVTDQEYAIPLWRQYVSRVELSLPIKPASRPLKKFDIHDRSDEGKTPPGSLLIGLLDDGCPFAASRFLKTLTSGGVSTRVRAIWDQNRDKQPVTINGSDFGQTLPDDFDYGLEYRRDFAPALAAGKIGLDDWIGLHSTPADGIDEDSCYAEAGFTSLAFQTAHGAHVMDVLAGTIPLSSRLGPFPPGDRRDPPSWNPGTDTASTAEVVFVQFSDDNLRDASGVWLPGYVLQGIQYVLSFAKLNVTNNVIINLSYGPTTGPHDGLWQLETALTALVAEYNGTGGKPKLDVVLAAGNSYLTESHVVFRGHQQPDQVEWIWRLPPDNTVLCFAEVWMKTGDAADIVVTLISPSGTSYASNVVTPNPSPAGVGSPTPGSSDDTMWRLEVKPTIASAGLVAEHGDWTIKVTGVPEHAAVHAYVARTDPNMNMITGAKRSFFVDGEWEETRSASASCTFVDGEFDNSGSLIHRHGTLNGTATAEDSGVHVAGGYVVLDGRKSPYSSAGPARRGPLPHRRVGPDYVMPCDESYALQGVLAGGTRSGSVFRLIGTSAAAPQLARWVVDASLPTPSDVPSPGDTIEIEKRGGGDLAPP